jgi:prepilin-type processing-associated H-X9-DG protein
MAGCKPWGVYILPFLEQDALFKRFNTKYNFQLALSGGLPATQGLAVTFNNPPNNTNVTDQNLNPAATPLKIYQCPSSPSNGEVYTDIWSNNGVGQNESSGPYAGSVSWTVSATDYCAASGVPHGIWNIYLPGFIPPYNAENGILNDNGIVTTIPQIYDGTSNTWLVGECGGQPNFWITGPTVYDTPPFNKGLASISGGGWADETNGDKWLGGNTSDGLNPGGGGPCFINCDNISGFFSFHRVGANFLYADGHVSFLTQALNPVIVILSVSYSDGQVIPALP